MIDLDITELFEEIVKELPEGLEILYPNGKGGTKVVKSPRLNYIFGSSQYIKDILDEYSKSSAQSERKFPLVALFTPISEDRGDADYFSKAKVSLIIACSSCKEWSMRCAEPHLLKISFGQSINVYWKYYMKIPGSTATMTKK